MKKTLLLLTLCCALIACKKHNVSFIYSPEAPRAGQAVQFTNQSSSGEEWEWSFGDGSTSTLKSPTHTFRNPGTYMVVLKVDNKKSLTASKELTVYDTIPTFVASDSVFAIYQEYTFTANLYNPYNYDVTYNWWFPINTPYVRLLSENTTGASIRLLFTQAMEEAPIWLTVVLNGDTTEVQQSFDVLDRSTNSIVLRTKDGDYRQRVFGDWADWQIIKDATATPILDAEQDTVQTYNGHDFTLSEVRTVFPDIEGFHIANRKIYYRANGLWVANIDGSNSVQIDTAACAAMTIDTYDNRIYWANKAGVWYMPFIGSDNNKFVTEPVQLNPWGNVTKIAADYELK